ncbi:thioredoxin [Candidatus Dojkabacteria bacterium]|nr:thioredoxin [Candidatus Dojkabacteria bacterium]
MSHMVLTDDNFEDQVLNSEKVVLVDFWAAWCMPCQMLGPIIEELAEEMGDKIVVGKMNVDENKETAGKYNIMSIPSVLVFKGGQVVDQLIGLRQKDDYKKIVESHLS